jgi:phage tail sheath protein FI
MPEYLSPGVYVEEQPAAVKPIAGVGTSTAAFIGLVRDDVPMPPIPGKFQPSEQEQPAPTTDAGGESTSSGAATGTATAVRAKAEPIPVLYEVAEAGEPTLITSWESFKNHFGDFDAGNQTLAHAVYGFFHNGGTRCWVARIAPAAASATGGASTQPAAPAATEPTPAADTTPEAAAAAGPVGAPGSGDVEGVKQALERLEAIDEVSLVAAPGALDDAIQGAVVDHCLNTGDRFAILDGQRVTTYTPAEVQGNVAADPKGYAALYFPWIRVYDPVTGTQAYVPPSGHLAGVYARVDSERGVHKAPANELIRGAVGVEARLSKSDQDGLNPSGINVIRAFDSNVTVWGARTLGGDANAEWKYVSVRRLFLYLRESIDQGTRWAVFEPNDPTLWAKITRSVTGFLTNVWRAGALFGATPAEAFYVRCDATTNPPELRDLGQVVTEIGVAVVKPAEFVVFRISQWSGPNGS